MSIYVEIRIRGDMESLWQTQEPKLHQRWDLRFSEIDYLPRRPGEPQKFLYRQVLEWACGSTERGKHGRAR